MIIKDKVMTDKEKAKAYDKALERAKEELGSGSFDRGSIEYIFPELKESKDKRVKNCIKSILKDADFTHFSECDVTFNDCIAWLEKQGEQKPAEVPMTLDEAIEHCKEKACGNSACNFLHKQLAQWLTELKSYKEQKLVEWSEEDENTIARTISIIKWAAYSDHSHPIINDSGATDVIERLKHIKDRGLPQSKQGWSEEERIRKDIMWCIANNIRNDNDTINPHVFTTRKEALVWLKKQGDTVEGVLKAQDTGYPDIHIDQVYSIENIINKPKGVNLGDKVIIQVRRKE